MQGIKKCTNGGTISSLELNPRHYSSPLLFLEDMGVPAGASPRLPHLLKRQPRRRRPHAMRLRPHRHGRLLGVRGAARAGHGPHTRVRLSGAGHHGDGK